MGNQTKLRTIATLVGVAIVLILGLTAYNMFKPPAAASGPITAIPLAVDTAVTSDEDTATTTEETTAPVVEAASTAAPQATTVAPSGETASAAASDEPAAAPEDGADLVVAQIVPEESEARFYIDEVLDGEPKTVVGMTNQVAGQIAVDPNDPSKSQVGTIQVNARTLTTDSEMRNRMLMNRILTTGEYEFITFTPTQIVGLPSTGAVGESYTFHLVGDLTIRGTTKKVTFDVSATPTSETRLEGTAKATILYADYGINIPQVPRVASVEDEVRLEIDFVAVAS